jgi:hypothetical protein
MKRLLLSAFCAWAAIGCVTAQTHRYKPEFHLSERNFCDTIPIEVEDGQIYLTVESGGRRMRLNLDTGSSQGMVYDGPEAASWQELGNIVTHDANNRADTVKVVRMPAFKMGRLVIDGYVASVIPVPKSQKTGTVGRKYDAIIGFDLFNSGLCGKIDARRKVLILSDRKKAFATEGGYSVKYKLKWFVPYLYVSPFMRHTDETLFDTGAQQLYTMSKQSFDRHLQDDLARLKPLAGMEGSVESQVEERARGQLSIGAFGAEQEDEVVFLRLDRLKWGDYAFRQVGAITTQGASRLGAAVLRHGSVVINPFKKQLVFQPYDGGSETVVGNKLFGVAYVPRNGRAAVGLIRRGSDEYKAGMRQGDIILSIDGKPVRSFADFRRFSFITGNRHRLLLQDSGGRQKEVMLQK